MCGTIAVSSPAVAATFDDTFTGTTLGPNWHTNIPVAGPTIEVNNGLKITTPDTVAFDNWNTVANAPEITTAAPTGDFTVSAEVDSIVDPDGNPVEGQNYHAALVVTFSKMDVFVWGDYRSNSYLNLERSGTNNIGNITLTKNPNWVQITKKGNDYTFQYKENEADAWQPLVDADGKEIVQTVAIPPVSVGLMLKTWGNVAATATWKNFHMEGDVVPPGKLSCKVTVTGGTTDQVRVQVVDDKGLVRGSAAPAADGTYTIDPIGSGTFTVRLTGDGDISSQPGASKTGVVIPANGAGTADLTGAISPGPDPTKDILAEDDFAGTSLKSMWTLVSDGTANVTVKDALIFDLPAGGLDHWTGFNNAPHITMPAPSGDFIETAKLASVVGPDGQPVEDLNYHSAMTIYFDTDQFEATMFGAYRSNKFIKLEVTGSGKVGGNIPALPAWVQVRKSGQNYTFFYRTQDTGSWTPLFADDGSVLTYTRADAPLTVGLEQKTWGDGAELTATWNRFTLQNNTGTGPIPGDLNADGKVNVQDATLSLNIAVGNLQPTDAQKAAGDFNGDGKLNIQDTTLILNKAVSG